MKGKTKNDSKENYLDFIPMRNEEIKWHRDRREKIVLEVEHKGFFHKIAQTVFAKPEKSSIQLDGMGTFIWPLIDGQTSVYELGAAISARFGEKAEPLYPRLIKYLQIMESEKLIKYI